jgi:hypothetical protein
MHGEPHATPIEQQHSERLLSCGKLFSQRPWLSLVQHEPLRLSGKSHTVGKIDFVCGPTYADSSGVVQNRSGVALAFVRAESVDALAVEASLGAQLSALVDVLAHESVRI